MVLPSECNGWAQRSIVTCGDARTADVPTVSRGVTEAAQKSSVAVRYTAVEEALVGHGIVVGTCPSSGTVVPR